MRHTNTQACIWYDKVKQCTNKEREFRDNGSNANNKMCFEVRAPSSTSPPSPRRISNPLSCPPREPPPRRICTTTGSTELLSQPIQAPPRQTITTSHKRGRPVAKQPQSTSTEEGYKHQPTPPHQEGVNHNLNLYQRGSNQQPKSTSTKEGYHKWKGLQLGGFHNLKQFLFPQINDPNRIG